MLPSCSVQPGPCDIQASARVSGSKDPVTQPLAVEIRLIIPPRETSSRAIPKPVELNPSIAKDCPSISPVTA